jgi:thiol-disulfide isomerase/thioredoxin
MATELNFINFFPFMKNNHIAVVLFYTTWCEPCRRFFKIWDRLEGKLGSRAVIGKVDIENSRLLRQMFNISTAPTFVFYVNGREKFRKNGTMNMDDILKKVSELGG